VPYGREGGLQLPPVREALNRAGLNIRYSARRMSLCEALFSTWISTRNTSRVAVTPFLAGELLVSMPVSTRPAA
jgi:hypothetical protein